MWAHHKNQKKKKVEPQEVIVEENWRTTELKLTTDTKKIVELTNLEATLVEERVEKTFNVQFSVSFLLVFMCLEVPA